MIRYFDGGMGSMLNLAAGELPELLNLTQPERVLKIHMAYAAAGADIITANTFGANPLKYDNCADIVRAGVALAKQTGKKVALDLGPTGKLLKPLGDLAFEDCVAAYAEVVKAGSGADLILLETMSDTYEIKAAMLAAKENSDLPVFVSMMFDENGRLLTGADVATACALVEGLGADVIGFNCGLGPKQLLPLVRELRAYTSLPIMVNPNAGLPEVINGETVYTVNAEEFSALMADIARVGVSYLGGCCGTTPAHIKALIETTKEIPDSVPEAKHRTLVTSYSECVELGKKSVVIGERINPTGKKLLKQALRENDMDYVLREGIAQRECGAHILDVNVGLPEIDEKAMLCRAVYELQAVLPTPLQLDTADTEAMEAALRLYNGKPLINSASGKEKSMAAVFPLAKKYGGVTVCLCLDENGIPETAAGRIAIAEKMIATAATYGIDKKDLVIDALTMTISTDQQNAVETLKAVDYLKNTLGVNTVLGVSNISFGLPNREAINTAFYTEALAAGLSGGIINPKSQAMMNAYYAHNALAGLDDSCTEYIRSATAIDTTVAPTEVSLYDAIIKGMKEESARCAAQLLDSTEALAIINEHIIPALDKVGDGFEKNTVFLPQLLMSADAAKAAFDAIKAHMILHDTAAVKGDKIIVATVEGDIHDIGKNIVKVLLQNYGFDVIDLGKDVPCETVLEEVQKRGVKLVGLSALMTTTVPNMEKTIRLLHDNTDAKVFVGGAVLTKSYAAMIEADWYARDAMESVRIAQEFFDTAD